MNTILKTISFKNLSNWSVAHLLANDFDYNETFPLVRIGSFLTRNKTRIEIEDETVYKRVTIRLYNKGVKLRNSEIGKNIGTKKQFLIKKGHFLLSKIDARNGAFGIATEEIDGAIITADFFAYDIDETKIDPLFLVLITTTKQFQKFAQSASSGTTGRQRIDETKFLDVKIPLPNITRQKKILDLYKKRKKTAAIFENSIVQEKGNIQKTIKEQLLIKEVELSKFQLLSFIKYKKLNSWSVRDLKESQTIQSNQFNVFSLNDKIELSELVIRGKSPKYDITSDKIILNQKCIRWNKIEIEHAKKVNTEWYSKIDSKHFTKEGDILINSTGEGTIGRASYIYKSFENLLFDSHILLLRVNKNKINPIFLTHYINSNLGQSQIENIKSAMATKQTELGINNLKRIQFVVPSLEIQNNIAVRLELLNANISISREKVINSRKTAKSEFVKEIFNEIN